MIHCNRIYQIDYFCGWRYLVSPTFRQKIRDSWGGSLWTKTFFVFGGAIGMIVTSAVAMLVLVLAWQTIGST